jgi:hypothetical protein
LEAFEAEALRIEAPTDPEPPALAGPSAAHLAAGGCGRSTNREIGTGHPVETSPSGGLPTALEIISEYVAALAEAPLSPESRRTYLSRVRMYLAWLGQHNPTAPRAIRSPTPGARDWAVRDYRLWLLRDGPAKRSVVYANSALTAIDDFYTRRGLGRVDDAH